MRYYFIQNEPEAILEVQRYLIALFYAADGERVAGDGIFGDETEFAVKEFQKKQGLDETGSVDRKTFERLFGAYREAAQSKEEAPFLPAGAEIPAFARSGERSPMVERLQERLIALLTHYGEKSYLRKSGYFDLATERAVKRLQHIFKEEESGKVSLRFYQRLEAAVLAEERVY